MSDPAQIRRLQGTADILPEESFRWDRLESVVRAVMGRYAFGEIRVPILEPTELFNKGTGESTDIVQKEMYTLIDRGNRSLTLRPEGTPSVVRAYLEENLGALRPLWKLFYIGPMFRAERPQKGRYRQFHQYGAEMMGAASPTADVEVIALGRDILSAAGIDDSRLVINSIGSRDARATYDLRLREFLDRPHVVSAICEDCRRRAASNPLRIFDCKKESCAAVIADAPTIDNYLTTADREHFEFVTQSLTGLGIDFEVDVRMVRGLDYYTRTTFEFKTDRLGAQDALCGGGRYDYLVETLGGPSTPAVGFAAGMERILAVVEAMERTAEKPARMDVFVCVLGDRARAALPGVLSKLRTMDLSADAEFLERGLKAQLKEAARLGARLALIIGDNEIERRQLTLRRMDASDQIEIPAEPSLWNRDLFCDPSTP